MRALFWIVFLPVSLAIGVYYWNTNAPHKNNPYLTHFIVNHYIEQIANSDKRKASKAWDKLNTLYLEHCATVLNVMKHRTDKRPIHFAIAPGMFSITGHPSVPGFVAYEEDSNSRCHTVGEAVSAILYNRHAWKTDYASDWNAWWQANRQHYELSNI